MNIKLRQLRAFKAIVERGSVTEASNTLGLTQSSVSKLLASFEAELGFQLFERVGRRLRLSEQGRLFYRKAENALDLLEDIRRAGLDIRDNQGRRIRVCAIGPLAYSRLIPEALAKFAARHPEFTCSIEMKARIEIEDWILNGHSDFGFTLLPVDRNRLNSETIARVRAVAIVPVGHRLSSRASLSPADLEDADIVLPRSSVRLRDLVEADFVKAGASLRPRIETSNAISTAHIVAQGVGVAVIDPFSLTGIPASSFNVIEWKPETWLAYGIVWPKSRSLTLHERQFLEEVASVAAHLAARFPPTPETGAAGAHEVQRI